MNINATISINRDSRDVICVRITDEVSRVMQYLCFGFNWKRKK